MDYIKNTAGLLAEAEDVSCMWGQCDRGARPIVSSIQWECCVAEATRLFERLREVASIREKSLFVDFLPRAYAYATLSCVPSELWELAMAIKLRLGMLITVYDDLADNPKLRDPVLLEKLYQLPLRREGDRTLDLNERQLKLLHFARDLWDEAIVSLRTLPAYSSLWRVFQFDVQQIYNANQYSQLITEFPNLANRDESRCYQAHDMGMIAVGTIDLMASCNTISSELGSIRRVLFHGQVAGKLSNVLTTWRREILEGDLTSEIVASANDSGVCNIEKSLHAAHSYFSAATPEIDALVASLEHELVMIFQTIEKIGATLKTFDVRQYVANLRKIHELHKTYELFVRTQASGDS